MSVAKPSEDLRFSHLGLYTLDLDRMSHFYRTALRFTQTDEGFLGSVRLIFLSRSPMDHHQLALASGRVQDLPFSPINQVSFHVRDLPTLRQYHARLLSNGATDMQPATHGNAVSIYCRDPEGNRLELFFDTPWYCQQPLRVPVDLSLPDAAIMAQVEALARSQPKFMSRAQWQADIERQMLLDQNS